MKKLLLLLSTALICYLGTEAQTFKDDTPSSIVREMDFPTSAVGDLNGDGKLDLVLMGQNNALGGKREVQVYLNNEIDGLKLAAITGIDVGMSWGYVDLGDQDKDGDLDIVLQGWQPAEGGDVQKCYVYNNDGNGVFTQVAELEGRSNGTVEWGDYDNDGDLDILQIGWFAALNTGKATIYKNSGQNVFESIEHPVGGLADGHAHWGDFDNDGNLDIIISGWNKTEIYKGNGAGAFNKTDFGIPQNYDFAFVDWIDYNKDGNLDFVIAGLVPGSDPARFETKVYKGNGDGTFTDSNISLPGVQRGPIVVGDCNHDGFLDFFVSGWSGAGTFAIYKNDGTNQNFEAVADVNTVIPGWADGTLQVADFNGDGWDEIFKSGWNSGGIYSNIDAVSSVIEISNSDQISIIQNQTNILIETKDVLEDLNVVMYDLSGRVISMKKIENSNTSSISMNGLRKGYYVVRVFNNNTLKTKMILKR